MRRNTELNRDFSRHNAFLLPFLHMGKSHAGFQLQTGQNSSCHSAVTSQGSTPQGKLVWLHLSSIPHEHLRTAKHVVWGELRQALHTFRIERDKRHPPSKLSCFQKQLHDFQRHHSPQYISTSHWVRAASVVNHSFQLTAVWLQKI